MINNLYKIEDMVKNVLEKFDDARSDDFILVYRVYQQLNEKAIVRQPFFEVMLNHKTYNLPFFSSITRARRKLQKNNPELANKKVKDNRLNATSDYINYAIDGYSSKFSEFVDSQK